MNPSPLPRCTPESVGVPSRAVLDCLKDLCHDETTMNGFMAARHGKVFAECWWAPYGPDLVHCNHSFGTSYTATAIGIAVWAYINRTLKHHPNASEPSDVSHQGENGHEPKA